MAKEITKNAQNKLLPSLLNKKEETDKEKNGTRYPTRNHLRCTGDV